MTDPFARPVPPASPPSRREEPRGPAAFTPEAVNIAEPDFGGTDEAASEALPPPRKPSWPARFAWATGGLFVSLAVGLLADQVIEGLFARYSWLGWAGVVIAAGFVIAILALGARELWALRRLRQLDHVRRQAAEALASDRRADGQAVAHELSRLYAERPDMARPRTTFDAHVGELFDGGDIVRYAERTLLSPLDLRARALTAASARRVALVTAISPRALVDIAIVVFESLRLAGAIAALYGARPGFFGFWRLIGAILSHLAVTGGLVLTDGLIEQLVGQGVAARLSQRLGEGVVNGLMTVRVGIAAARVVRPLPYTVDRPPQVRDFLPELTKVVRSGS
jgi:putative membrane protein